jgi:hypothetical protein
MLPVIAIKITMRYSTIIITVIINIMTIAVNPHLKLYIPSQLIQNGCKATERSAIQGYASKRASADGSTPKQLKSSSDEG